MTMITFMEMITVAMLMINLVVVLIDELFIIPCRRQQVMFIYGKQWCRSIMDVKTIEKRLRCDDGEDWSGM